MKTPVSQGARAEFAEMPPLEAVVRAWTDRGPFPAWHQKVQADIRKSMPLLADSLDRLAQERGGR